MIDGILLIDKPDKITSNFLVKKIKKHIENAVNIKVKIGHTGTLDFFATGLMIITIGKATRFTEYYQNLDKEYIAVGEFGKITDTYDINGKVIKENECNISEENFLNIVNSFIGEFEQIPPPYSSKRINGKRAYQLAKKGIEFQLKPKKIKIYDLQVININLPFFKLKIKCSSGTYIRSLIKEIGDKAGCGAYTHSLRRTKIDNFTVENAITLEQFLNFDANEISSNVLSLEDSLPFFDKITLDKGFDRRFLFGQRFKVPFEKKGLVKVFSYEKFLGIGKIGDDKILQPVKVLDL